MRTENVADFTHIFSISFWCLDKCLLINSLFDLIILISERFFRSKMSLIRSLIVSLIFLPIKSGCLGFDNKTIVSDASGELLTRSVQLELIYHKLLYFFHSIHSSRHLSICVFRASAMGISFLGRCIHVIVVSRVLCRRLELISLSNRAFHQISIVRMSRV